MPEEIPIGDTELEIALDEQKKKHGSTRGKEKRAMQAARSDMRRTSQLLLETLAASFTDEQVKATMKEMLNAEVVTRGGSIRPDYRTRLEAMKMYFAYIVGTPIQRQEQVNYNLDINDLEEDELIETLSKSPAMRKKVGDMLLAAEEQALKHEEDQPEHSG